MYAAKEMKKQAKDPVRLNRKKGYQKGIGRPRQFNGFSEPDSFLQRHLGNSHLQVIAGNWRNQSYAPTIQRKCVCGGVCASCVSQGTRQYSPALRVSSPNDSSERQADEAADRMMKQIGSRGLHGFKRDLHATRDADGVERQGRLILEDEKEGGVILKDAAEGATHISAGTMRKIPTPRTAVRASLPHVSRMDRSMENDLVPQCGPGLPIPKQLRTAVEPLLGYDLSPVRIYPNEGRKLAESIHARAFTLGRSIYFSDGEYRPSSPEGMRVLLHELVHTTQRHGLNGMVMRTPSISSWDFHNTDGNTTASDNCCALCPRPLGVGNRYSGRIVNGMELQAFISNDEPGASYDIKRVAEASVWERVGGSWNLIFNAPSGTPDDPNNDDECLNPVIKPPYLPFIYSEDQPGFGGTGGFNASATDVAFKGSFTESCEVTDATGNTTTASNSFDWHSILWLTKSGGSWGVDTARSEIEPGSVTVGTTAP